MEYPRIPKTRVFREKHGIPAWVSPTRTQTTEKQTFVSSASSCPKTEGGSCIVVRGVASLFWRLPTRSPPECHRTKISDPRRSVRRQSLLTAPVLTGADSAGFVRAETTDSSGAGRVSATRLFADSSCLAVKYRRNPIPANCCCLFFSSSQSISFARCHAAAWITARSCFFFGSKVARILRRTGLWTTFSSGISR